MSDTLQFVAGRLERHHPHDDDNLKESLIKWSVNSLECGGPAPLWPALAKPSTKAGQIGESGQGAAGPAHSKELTHPVDQRSLNCGGHSYAGFRIATVVASILLVILLFAGVIPVPPTIAGPSSASSAKKTLRVMTYNIHVGVGMDKKLDLQRIADVINREHPDLVGLQEVDRGVKRTEGKDEIAELAALTNMKYAFAHNIDYQGGQYGVAILSRFPIDAIDHRKFENKREAERRGMIRVEVNAGGKTINFVTTHLDYQFDDGRLFEAEQMLRFLHEVKGPLIVVGDFNDEPPGTTYKLAAQSFDDAWVRSRAKDAGLTYPADKPMKRIDYVFTRQSDRTKTKKAWVVNTLASDHLPLVADLELK
jgi:endonuclease/exonuclease/phosphatase family metal-dependent hydrolase